MPRDTGRAPDKRTKRPPKDHAGLTVEERRLLCAAETIRVTEGRATRGAALSEAFRREGVPRREWHKIENRLRRRLDELGVADPRLTGFPVELQGTVCARRGRALADTTLIKAFPADDD